MVIISTSMLLKSWWTTYRLPWQPVPTIAYATRTPDPMAPELRHVRDHELVHAGDMRTFWQLGKAAALYFVVPLPTGFSGRWYFERHAYLKDIEAGVLTPQMAAEQLWRFYFWPWPRKRMERWFERAGSGNDDI